MRLETLRKLLLLACVLLMVGCGQPSGLNSSNAGDHAPAVAPSGNAVASNANAVASNANAVASNANGRAAPGPNGTATPRAVAANANAARPLETPTKQSNLPRYDELGNDAQRADDKESPAPPAATNGNVRRPPRIEERKPPQREQPE